MIKGITVEIFTKLSPPKILGPGMTLIDQAEGTRKFVLFKRKRSFIMGIGPLETHTYAALESAMHHRPYAEKLDVARFAGGGIMAFVYENGIMVARFFHWHEDSCRPFDPDLAAPEVIARLQEILQVPVQVKIPLLGRRRWRYELRKWFDRIKGKPQE